MDTQTKPTQVRLKRWLPLLSTVAAAAIGTVFAVRYRWCSDDAFISFRYARNLADGHGLVYNIGERVEGYTNFLWTVIISLGMWLGQDPVVLSWVLSTLAFVITGALCFVAHRMISRDRSTAIFVFPVAAVGVMLMHDMQSWATSGLETMFTTMLVAAAFVLLVRAEKPTDYSLAGIVNVLAAMTRPDALQFAVMAVPFVFLAGRERWRSILFYIVPVLLLYLPYWYLKYSYYGYPFPNPYYAKSASVAYWSQGWIYVWMFLKSYYALLAVLPAIGWGAWLALRSLRARSRIHGKTDRVLVLGLLWMVPFFVYVVRVGGDFMFARFLIPVVPLILLSIEAMIVKAFPRGLTATAIGAVLVLLLLFRVPPFDPPHETIDGITDERIQYPVELIEKAQVDGARIKRCLAGLDVKAAYYGKAAMYAYYSEVPYAIEAAGALTDTAYAHRPVATRDRPGHEKRIPYDTLAARGIHFLLGGTLRATPDPSIPGVILFDGAICHIVTYHNDVMERLKRRDGVEFLDFPAFLDDYIAVIETVPPQEIATDMPFLEEYYFRWNDDLERRQVFLNRISGQ